MPSAASVGKYWEFATVTEVGSCFGRHVRRPQVVDLADYIDMLEATLSTDDLLRLDLVVSGPLRQAFDAGEIWLAIEISSAMDRNDIARAVRRADFFRQAGYRAIPVAVGARATRGTAAYTESQQVVLLEDGRFYS